MPWISRRARPEGVEQSDGRVDVELLNGCAEEVLAWEWRVESDEGEGEVWMVIEGMTDCAGVP